MLQYYAAKNLDKIAQSATTPLKPDESENLKSAANVALFKKDDCLFIAVEVSINANQLTA